MREQLSHGHVGIRRARESGSSLGPAGRVSATMIPSADTKRILVTGATGYVGGELLPALLGRRPRRALPRARPARAGLPGGGDGRPGRRRQRRRARRGAATASTSPTTSSTAWSGKGGDFAERDRRGADDVRRGRRATPGVGRIVYLGGLRGGPRDVRAPAQPRGGRRASSPRTSPRRSTSARRWSSARGSASFLMLRSLVERLPVDGHARAGSTPARSRSRSRDVVAHARRAGRARRTRPRRSSSAAPTS